jgi:hypothetical protein
MTGWGVVAVGLLLCFFGLWSLHVAVLGSGFALGWLLADALGADLGVVAVIAVASALVAWFVATFVLKAALLVVGGVAGGVIGAKLFGLLQGDDGSAVLAVLFVLAVAALVGLATQRFERRVLIWACAFGGAGLALTGAAQALPDLLQFLRTPEGALEGLFAGAAWIALALAGWSVQRARIQAAPTPT